MPQNATYIPNPIYTALMTADAPFAMSHGLALRFQPDPIPLAPAPDWSDEALQDLAALLNPGEEVWTTIEDDQTMPSVPSLELGKTLRSLQMRYVANGPENAFDDVFQLTEADAEAMLSLKQLAYPGFFGLRAPELGSFFGIRDKDTGELVAMGGERLATAHDHEISAVCTHPQYAGKGYAARIMQAVLAHQKQQGVGSFLHVAAANDRAISLYKRLQFRTEGVIQFVQLRKVNA